MTQENPCQKVVSEAEKKISQMNKISIYGANDEFMAPLNFSIFFLATI